MYIGCHVSIRDGYKNAAVHAKKLGANTFQYFPKNPRSLVPKEYGAEDTASCKDYCETNNIVSFSHSPYPTKLIADDPKTEELVIQSIKNDLEITNSCGSIGVVVHFGTTSSTDPIEGYKRLIHVLNECLSDWNGTSLILLENNAGGRSMMGTTLEEMVQIRKLVDYPEKIGFCFDTCHAFASGVWDGNNWNELEEKGQQLDYFNHLKLIHLNNSKYPSGMKKDRHANLMNGHITTSQWLRFLQSPAIKNIPLILETPNEEKDAHEKEINLVNKWLK
ncbi:MAG: deoxyribonuclease IV [Bacillaceae bacterium]|nr:deoxyribonuclease IV [Bacillaceae bacterium]